MELRKVIRGVIEESLLLEEEFVTAEKIDNKFTRVKGILTLIYRNPPAREVKEIFEHLWMDDSTEIDELRYAFDENYDLYVWRGDVFHQDMERFLNTSWIIRGSQSGGRTSSRATSFEGHTLPDNMDRELVLTRILRAFPSVGDIMLLGDRKDPFIWDKKNGWLR